MHLVLRLLCRRLEVSNLISKLANQDGSSLRNSVYVGGAVRADFFDENLASSTGAACDFHAHV